MSCKNAIAHLPTANEGASPVENQKGKSVVEITFDNSTIKKEMEKLSHAFDENHPNPYHMEGSILNHTNMVCGHTAHLIDACEITKPYSEFLKNISLGHDFGKLRTVQQLEDKKKRAFYQHPNWSQAMFYQFIAENDLLPAVGDETALYAQMVTIALHNDSLPALWGSDSLSANEIKKWGTILRYNPELAPMLLSMNYSDDNGRIKADPSFAGNAGREKNFALALSNEIQDSIPAREDTPLIPDVTQGYQAVIDSLRDIPAVILMTGLSGSGKSTIRAEMMSDYGEENCLLVSFDSAVNEIAQKYGISYGEMFARGANGNQSHLKEAESLMNRRLQEQLVKSAPKHILIDKTHLGVKSRFRSINQICSLVNRIQKSQSAELPEYKVVAVQTIIPYEMCEPRIESRKGHPVDHGAFNAQIGRYTPVFYGERPDMWGKEKPWSYDHIINVWTDVAGNVKSGEYIPAPATMVAENYRLQEMIDFIGKENK